MSSITAPTCRSASIPTRCLRTSSASPRRHRNLQWREEFAARGQAFELTAGKAVYVPVKAPHWVRNGPEVSVSLSITWQSEWAYREQYARAMNGMLRRFGLDPASPKRYPHQNHAKSLAWRAIDKAKRVVTR
ncbi:MAG: hypothetical protein LC634_11060 [Sphingomonadales bacterium]|nr:hypothetical protein [Sphingomonadales bacterium]